MDENAIIVHDVSKTFKLPHEKHSSIKSLFVNMFRKSRTFEKQKVLNGVSFEIKKGEFFGIVGRNGSGKSTLLKLLAGIYSPDSGSIDVRGKLTPFIELGVGFNPELTGRENVYLNGALLGFDRRQMDKMYDDIVEFAELKKFMDQKLKNYSSGMQVRLAFSIAIRAQSDILLIDEVLAVGDNAFQAKCYEYFRTLKVNNKTVIFVSHDMHSVQDFCDRALLIDKGKVRAVGKPVDIASLYLLNTAGGHVHQNQDAHINEDAGIELLEVKMSKSERIFSPSEPISFTLEYQIKKELPHHLGISILKNGTSIHERNTKDVKLDSSPGKHSVVWQADASSLLEGLHTINIAAFSKREFKLLAYINDANNFMVERKEKGVAGLFDMKSKWKDIT